MSLEGSVQRGGTRLRVNVQLVDAQNGKHLWAERFDKPVADLFDMQDEIVARLAERSWGTVLIASEARRAERTPDPDAFDLYLQGMAWLDKDPRPVNVAQSRAFFARALAIEADNVDALIGSAGADLSGGDQLGKPRTGGPLRFSRGIVVEGAVSGTRQRYGPYVAELCGRSCGWLPRLTFVHRILGGR